MSPLISEGSAHSRRCVIRLALALFLALVSACADGKPGKSFGSAGNRSVEERDALYQQAREGLRQARERYIATTRPVLQRQFQQEYPTMPEAEIEVLVNDALEQGLRPVAGQRPDGPIGPHHMDCLSSPWKHSVSANCE